MSFLLAGVEYVQFEFLSYVLLTLVRIALQSLPLVLQPMHRPLSGLRLPQVAVKVIVVEVCGRLFLMRRGLFIIPKLLFLIISRRFSKKQLSRFELIYAFWLNKYDPNLLNKSWQISLLNKGLMTDLSLP